jgi:transposase-like protein
LTKIFLLSQQKIFIQRYKCLTCGHTFSEQDKNNFSGLYSPEIKFEACRMYFEQEASYRNTAKNLSGRLGKKIRPATVFEWINTLGEKCKSSIDIYRELKPYWSGYLQLDGKSIFVKGEEFSLLLAVDTLTQDIIDFELCESENYESYLNLLKRLKNRLFYDFKAVTSDQDPGLIKAVREVAPDSPHQYCLKHEISYLNYQLSYQVTIDKELKEKFLELCKFTVFVDSKKHFEKAFKIYEEKISEFYKEPLTKIINKFESKFNHFWFYLEDENIQRTNNVIEGVIRQLSRKIDDTDGYETFNTALNSLKLTILNYRFKKFSCSRKKNHNGKSPLELAGVNTKNIDWVAFSQK